LGNQARGGSKNIKRIEELLQIVDVSQYKRYTQLPLFGAVRSGDVEVVKKLLDAGAKIDMLNKDGESVLHWAISFKNLDMFEFLFHNGASVHINTRRKNSQQTPLMWSLENKQRLISEFLIENGAEWKETPKGAKPAFFIAIQRKDFKTFEFMLENGADVNEIWESPAGLRTPLSVAIKSRCHYGSEDRSGETIKMLVEKGADFMFSLQETTPWGEKKTVWREWLIRDFPHAIATRISLGHEFTMKDSVKFAHGTTLHAILSYPLSDLMTTNMFEFARITTPNVDAQDIKGNTALNLAAKNFKTTEIKLLLKYGADPFIPNHKGETFLLLLIRDTWWRYYTKVTLEIVATCFDLGASLFDTYEIDGEEITFEELVISKTSDYDQHTQRLEATDKQFLKDLREITPRGANIKG